MQSVKIAKLKTKPNQRTEICKYKIDTCSHDYLMHIRMFQILYPNTMIPDLYKSID